MKFALRQWRVFLYYRSLIYQKYIYVNKILIFLRSFSVCEKEKYANENYC